MKRWTMGACNGRVDGRQILWAQVDRTESDIMLNEDFR